MPINSQNTIVDERGPLPQRRFRFVVASGNQLLLFSASGAGREPGEIGLSILIDDKEIGRSSVFANHPNTHLPFVQRAFVLRLQPGPHYLTLQPTSERTVIDKNDYLFASFFETAGFAGDSTQTENAAAGGLDYYQRVDIQSLYDITETQSRAVAQLAAEVTAMTKDLTTKFDTLLKVLTSAISPGSYEIGQQPSIDLPATVEAPRGTARVAAPRDAE